MLSIRLSKFKESIIIAYFTIIANSTSKQICSHDNYNRIKPFLQQRWLDARYEIGLPLIVNQNECHKSKTIVDERICKQMQSWHNSMIETFFKFTTKEFH